MSNHTIHRKSFSGRLKKNTLKSANILQRDGKGNIISPNGTGRIVKIFTGGHTSGYEFRFQRDFAETAGMSQKDFNQPRMFGNHSLYQIEDKSENLSHNFEEHDRDQGMANVTMYAAGQDPEIMKNLYVEQNNDSDTVYYRGEDGEMKELYTLPHEEQPLELSQEESSENANVSEDYSEVVPEDISEYSFIETSDADYLSCSDDELDFSSSDSDSSYESESDESESDSVSDNDGYTL